MIQFNWVSVATLFFLTILPLWAPSSFGGVIPVEMQSIIETDFEHHGWYFKDWKGGLSVDEISLPNPFRANIVDDPANSSSGNRVLKWEIKEGRHSSARLISDELDRPEAWASYRVYIPESFGGYDLGSDADDASKLPGFTACGDGSGNQTPANGSNGWSARVGWKVDPKTNEFKLGFYTYHADQEATWGDWMDWHTSLSRGTWHTITQHLKVNTLGEQKGNKDGILEAYVDDVLVFSRTNLRFTDIPDYSNISRFWLTFYFGGTSKAPKDLHLYLDDVNIYGPPKVPALNINAVYPNPVLSSEFSETHIKVTVNKAGPFRFYLMNLQGQVLDETETQFLSVGDADILFNTKCNNLPAGLYFVRSAFGSFPRVGSGSELGNTVKLLLF